MTQTEIKGTYWQDSTGFCTAQIRVERGDGVRPAMVRVDELNLDSALLADDARALSSFLILFASYCDVLNEEERTQ